MIDGRYKWEFSLNNFLLPIVIELIVVMYRSQMDCWNLEFSESRRPPSLTVTMPILSYFWVVISVMYVVLFILGKCLLDSDQLFIFAEVWL